MGFFDSLFGGLFGGGASGGSSGFSGNRGYDKLLGWAERRVGPLKKGMSDAEIENYISSINKKKTAEGAPLTEEAIDALRDYMKRKFGQ